FVVEGRQARSTVSEPQTVVAPGAVMTIPRPCTPEAQARHPGRPGGAPTLWASLARRCAATGSRPTTGADLGAASPARRSSERFAVRNALGAVQSLLVLGGSSDIGAAIAERLVPGG